MTSNLRRIRHLFATALQDVNYANQRMMTLQGPRIR
jgi:hypothetical protein